MNVSQHANKIDAGCTLQTFVSNCSNNSAICESDIKTRFALYAAPTALKPTFPSLILEMQAFVPKHSTIVISLALPYCREQGPSLLCLMPFKVRSPSGRRQRSLLQLTTRGQELDSMDRKAAASPGRREYYLYRSRPREMTVSKERASMNIIHRLSNSIQGTRASASEVATYQGTCDLLQ